MRTLIMLVGLALVTSPLIGCKDQSGSSNGELTDAGLPRQEITLRARFVRIEHAVTRMPLPASIYRIVGGKYDGFELYLGFLPTEPITFRRFKIYDPEDDNIISYGTESRVSR